MKKIKLNIQMFASTNKTTNYELPQFIGTDKPSWLGDINSAMSTIDGGMHDNATAIDGIESTVQTATATATQASVDVQNLTSTVNTLSTNVSSVETTANNAQTTSISALNTANTANGKADTNASNISSLTSRVTNAEANIANFNLTKFETPTISRASGTFTIRNGASITVARNEDGSLAKIYGVVVCDNITANGTISFQTALRPPTNITINGGCIKNNWHGTNGGYAINNAPITIQTNGLVTVPVSWTAQSGENCRFVFINSLIFVKDFGDIEISGD